MLADAMSRIKAYYPATLVDFVTILNDSSLWYNTSMIHCEVNSPEVFNLARLVGTHSLFPAAFDRCCQVPPETLFGRLPDGTYSTACRLSDENIGRCMSGKA